MIATAVLSRQASAPHSVARQSEEPALFDNTDDEYEPLPSKSPIVRRKKGYSSSSGDSIESGSTGVHGTSADGEGDSSRDSVRIRGLPLEDLNNRDLANPAPVVMPLLGAPAPDTFGGWQQLPTLPLSPPPGTWIPRGQSDGRPEHNDAAGASAHAGEPPLAPGSVRLVKAVRAPPPLNHKKSHPVTSLTVNALPLQMRRTQLCALLDETGFAARYNYVYVPCNRDKTNRGHAFVNFCSPEDARIFFSAWHGARVVGLSSHSPVLSVSVSVVQGFEESVRRWTVARMLGCSDPDFSPFIAGMTQMLDQACPAEPCNVSGNANSVTTVAYAVNPVLAAR